MKAIGKLTLTNKQTATLLNLKRTEVLEAQVRLDALRYRAFKFFHGKGKRPPSWLWS